MIMPDIDFQKIELNLIPKKGDELVVFYASQYETARPFKAVLKWGNTEFVPDDDCYAEIDIRKNDDNIVVITDDVSIDNNEVSVILPVQAVTCIGKNLGQVKIYAADEQLIAALNFILEVQPDPLANGVQSETAIDNLTQQIEDIAQEVIGEDYYNKTETDALLADKADKSELPDMDDYYNKTQVDELIDNIFPTLSASGSIASFRTALNKQLVSVTPEAGANTITRCGKNLINNDNAEIGTAWNGNSASNRARIIIPCEPSTNYVLTMNGTMTVDGVYFCESETLPPSEISAVIFPKIFTTASTSKYITLGFNKSNISQADIDGLKVQLEKGSTATAYEPYRGQKVPVADATSLTTLSGVNNVFADEGNVTVQYKYMSI